MCHQSVGLIQAAIESAQMTTVSVSMLKEVTEQVRPPRVLYVPYPLGYPLGEPDNRVLQRKILSQALKLLALPQPPEGVLFQEFQA